MSQLIPRITVYCCASWVSLAQMDLRSTPHCYPSSRFRTRSLSSQQPPLHLPPHPSSTSQIVPPLLPLRLVSGGLHYCIFLMLSPVSLACWQWPRSILVLHTGPCFCSKTFQRWKRKSIFLDENPTCWGRLRTSKRREHDISGCRWEPWNWVII